jgi:regulator of replication initiation timing
MPEDQPDEAGQQAPESPQPAPAEELELVKARLKAVIQENHDIAETCAQLQEDKATLQLKVEDLVERLGRARLMAVELIARQRPVKARPGPAPPARRWTRG